MCHKLHTISSEAEAEVVVTAKLGEEGQAVNALLDSGAYANYLSEAWAKAHLKPELIEPVEGEYIQLGGTAKRLPVLGKTRLWVKIGEEHAKITFHIFQTERTHIT